MINLRTAGPLLLLLAMITGSAMGQDARPNGAAVRVVVTVADATGRPVSGLTQEQFSIVEKKNPLEIVSFDAEDKPVSIAFVFDLSTSMSPAFRKTSVQLAGQIMRSSNKANEYAIIGLREVPEVFCELGCNEAETTKALQQVAVAEIKEGRSKTYLYNGCALALKKLETSKNAKQVMIVFSDGQDNSSKLPFNKLRDAIKESSVIFYAFGLQSPDMSAYLSQESGKVLEELGTVTGGKAYFPIEAREMTQVADVIAMQLRQQYTIGFKPEAQAADNKWHSIKIKLTMPKTTGKSAAPFVRYREGYLSR
jgi:Ca-activated chloride channel family protein